MSTRISLSRTSTTRPRTTSPSSTSLTPRLNQYSMLSSVASTSFDTPTRVFDFRFSVSMTPPLLRIYFVGCALAPRRPTSQRYYRATTSPAEPADPGVDRSLASSPGPLHDTPPCARRHPLSFPRGAPRPCAPA